MTAYSPMFRPPTRRHGLSGPLRASDTTSPWAHEADVEAVEQVRTSYSFPSPSSSAPFESGDNLRYSQSHSDTDSRMRGCDVHGPTYHYGKMWESASLQEQHDTSAWTTTSSSEWTISHVHQDSAKLNLQYPPSRHVQIIAPSFESGISYDDPRFVEDVQPYPELRLRGPPILVPPDEVERSFVSTTWPSPRPILPLSSSAKPKYDAAHQPVPPEKYSSYSELSANLEYLQKLKQEELDRLRKPASTHRLTITIPKPAASTSATTTATKAVRLSPGSSHPPSPLKKRKRTKHILPHSERSLAASDEAGTANANSPSDTTSQETSASSSNGAKNCKEPRKTSLACIFCRERKISCGRPPPGSPDPTCNQCARRSFKCTYMNENTGKQLASSRRR